MAYAEVFLNQINKRIDHTYDYLVPVELRDKVKSGVRVVVPFGNGKRELEAFVIKVKGESRFFESARPILEVIDPSPILFKAQIDMCRWMRVYYACLFYEALRLFIHPAQYKKKADEVTYMGENKGEQVFSITQAGQQGKTRGIKMQGILDMLRVRDCTLQELKQALGDIGRGHKELIKKGWVVEYQRVAKPRSKVLGKAQIPKGNSADLYEYYQEKKNSGKPMFFCIKESLERFYLFCQMAWDVMQQGKTAVLIFPEIALSLRHKKLFYEYFGNAGAIYHGQMNLKEKYALFKGVKSGEISVVMGSRASLFLPYPRLGLIIIEEAGESAYYSQSMPRYHTLDVALNYGRFTKVQVVISETTPSVRTMYHIENDQWESMVIKENKKPSPIQLVDMVDEMRMGNLDFLSSALKNGLEKNQAKRKTSLLFLNRRGHNSHSFCRDCGYVAMCERCNVSLKAYPPSGLICPICGKEERQSVDCPKCHSKSYKPMVLGLDQIEGVLKRRYPHWNIVKIHGDMFKNQNERQAFIHQLEKNPVDIILGTQAIGGFSLPNLGLIGGVLVDGDLNHGDYASGEETYLLYTKILSLGDESTQVILQSYEVKNETLVALQSHNAEDFYRGELDYRQMMAYPPFGHLIVFGLNHPDEQVMMEEGGAFYETLKTQLSLEVDQVFSPQIKNQWQQNSRLIILIKVQKLNGFQKKIRELIEQGYIEKLKSKVSIEIDPPNIM